MGENRQTKLEEVHKSCCSFWRLLYLYFRWVRRIRTDRHNRTVWCDERSLDSATNKIPAIYWSGNCNTNLCKRSSNSWRSWQFGRDQGCDDPQHGDSPVYQASPNALRAFPPQRVLFQQPYLRFRRCRQLLLPKDEREWLPMDSDIDL